MITPAHLSASPTSRSAWRLGRYALGAGVAALAIHHMVLFGGRLVDGSILHPATAVRWLMSFALVAGLYGLKRRGLNLAHPRQLGSLAVLVLLLHAGMGQPTDAAFDPSAGLLAILPVSLVALGAVQLLAVSTRHRLAPRPAATAVWLHDLPVVDPRPGRGLAVWSARPPPVRFVA